MNPLLAALVQARAITPSEAERLNRLLDDDAARAWAEQQIAAAFSRALSLQQGRLQTFLEAEGAGVAAPALAAWWRQEDQLLYRDVLPVLTEIAGDRAIVAAVRSGGLEHWQVVNEAVIGWVEDYYISAEATAYGAIPNLNATARTQIGNLINQWQHGELEAATRAQGLPRLIAAMDDVFGPERGAVIAITETTRVFSESTRAAARANPNVTLLRWASARDELVCPICGPLDGQVIPKGQGTFPGGYFPPAHPNCRCRPLEETELTAQVPLGIGGAGTWNFVSRRT